MLTPAGQGPKTVCRSCGGNTTVTVERTKDGKVETIKVPCPACGGTGHSGYRTK